MSTDTHDTGIDKARAVIRTAWGISGLVALVIGLLILVWPGKTAAVVAAIIVVYAIITGLVYLGLGIFAQRFSPLARIGHAVLGVLFIAGGVVALMNLRTTTVVLALLLGIMIGILWIVEGVATLTLLGGVQSATWVIVYAVISILAGITLLFSPGYVLTLWWLLGIWLVVMGVVHIVHALRTRAVPA
ncbi:HdeD family acid-resistance protein [Raineyella sp. LH-20]|uniref:HdeD family acid-resistance protein n=1 Tax=Raineyella sp. LH-20 TaxID=3081204 RepID=UPI002955AC1B|nr:DUF308 domain-containing protein [Raineyella sp. LH-20]WOP17592.1 DUF308 domain-containing protein [Raineyella sp. LH-20]